MQEIRNNHLKMYGYIPTDSEILSLYRQGELMLTNNEEDDLLKYFNF
jgi:hypothetical protein